MHTDKKKVLVFHQALAPYRIDFWNSLNDNFDFHLYFTYHNLLDQKFNQSQLLSSLKFTPKYHTAGFRIGVRAFRLGFLNLIRKHKPDIIITYEYSQTTLTLILLKKIFNLKCKIYTICDDSLSIAQTCKGARKLARNYAAPKLDGIILANTSVSKWYKKNINLKKQPIIFPIITDENIFRKKLAQSIPLSNEIIEHFYLKNKKAILFVGRHVSVKGIDRLLLAFKKVKKKHVDSILLLVGDGDDQEILKKQSISLNLSDSVIFAGRHEALNLYAWFNVGQVFALLSHYEPFGAVVNEALLSGTPVVCSKYAGSSELITPGENGEIVDPYNIEEVSRVISNLLYKTLPIKSVDNIRPSLMQSSFEEYLKKLIKSINND